jgi:hypothetical protein
MNTDDVAALQDLLAKDAIRDVVYRYCHAIDRGDEALLTSVYWPEATEDHAGFRGSAREFVQGAMKEIYQQSEQMQHLVGNSLIRVTLPRAQVETYVYVYQRIPPRSPSDPNWNGRHWGERSDLLLGARYLDTFERRGAEWRILARTLAIDWWRLFKGSADWHAGLAGAPILMGARQKNDPSYSLFGSLIPQSSG